MNELLCTIEDVAFTVLNTPHGNMRLSTNEMIAQQ